MERTNLIFACSERKLGNGTDRRMPRAFVQGKGGWSVGNPTVTECVMGWGLDRASFICGTRKGLSVGNPTLAGSVKLWDPGEAEMVLCLFPNLETTCLWET